MTTYVPPVIEHSEWDETSERLLLFTITKPNPDYVAAGLEDEPETLDVDYTMPSKPHAGLALTFLRYARKQGLEIAMSWLLDEVVGEEAIDALAAEPDLDSTVLQDISRKVRDTVLGGLNGPKG